MKKYLMEFLGAFFLVLTIGLVSANSTIGLFAPIVIGSVLIAMVYTGAAISGAHYNPAVTLGAYLSKKITISTGMYYILSQLLGAIFAAYAVLFMHGPIDAIITISFLPAFIAELIFTFALVFIFMMVIYSKHTKGNSYFGMAIGLIVLVGTYTVAALSGAVFNPAVLVGLILMSVSSVSTVVIYLLSHIFAAILAAKVFDYMDS